MDWPPLCVGEPEACVGAECSQPERAGLRETVLPRNPYPTRSTIARCTLPYCSYVTDNNGLCLIFVGIWPLSPIPTHNIQHVHVSRQVSSLPLSPVD